MPPEFITVTAPKGRTYPVNPADGNDPAGVLLYVTHERVCRVRYSADTRRALREGDLIPVKITETIDPADGFASYVVHPQEMAPDPRDPMKQVPRAWTIEEADSPAPLANGDRIDIKNGKSLPREVPAPVIPTGDPAMDLIAAEVARANPTQNPVKPAEIPANEISKIAAAHAEPDQTVPAGGKE